MKSRFINFKVIINIIGLLLLIEGVFLALSLLVALIYGEDDVMAFVISTAITLAVGGIITLFTRNISRDLGKREGYIIVSIVWIIFSVFGSLPFIISGYIPDYTNAFFETISGFTTTGASILNDIEALPHGLLFWRSMTQWLGGMGIIVLSLAILPVFGIGGMQLFIAEVPGPTPDKLHPRIKDTAKRLWLIYVIFTVAQTLLMWIGEMNLFDAVCHSLTTLATGGYSTKQASAGAFSPYIQYIIILFMFLAGTNFTLSYYAFHMKFKKVWKNEEFRAYLGFTVVFTLVIALGLFLSNIPQAYNYGNSAEKSFRDSLFTVVSIMTTTGYGTADYLLWLPILTNLIFLVMFFGGSAGSTGGGMKIVRILLFLKNSRLEFKRLIHPNAIIPVRLNKRSVDPSIMTNVYAFVGIYMLIFIFGVLVMSILGCDLNTAMGAVIASLGNIGPGIGNVGPASNFYEIHDIGKWFLSFLMLMGRLELFTVLMILSPSFWKK